jgi:hypothetical protein
MKKGWETKRLADVLELQNGYAFNSKSFNPADGMPLIRIRSLKGGVETETRFNGDYDKKYVVTAGDLLIGMDGEFGCYEWKGEPALLNQRVCRLQGFSGALIPRFLFYGVNDYLKAIEDVTGYTTVKHISSRQILEIEFPVPPLAEQQRIVGILDEAFEGIATAKANAEKNLQNARALFQSVLAQSVIGETTKSWRAAGCGGKATADSDLKDLFRHIAATDRKPVRSEETTGREIITDALPEEWRHASIEQLFNLIDYRGKTASKSDTGHRLITARNIRMGFLSEEPVTFISKEQYKKWMVRGFPKPGDIFFVTEGHWHSMTP